jgi:Ca-activated chloride channel family protein
MTTKFFEATAGRRNLAVGEDHEVHVTFTFNSPAMDEKERAPLDIAVAMDISTSMGGPKIENAKQSLLKLVEHLKPGDRLALVVFSSFVETIFEQALMTTENKAKARDAINRLGPTGCTNLSGGLFKALDWLKESKALKGGLRRCMIFTDGQANEGIRDPDQLAKAALEYRNGIGISSFGYGRDAQEKLLEAISQDGDYYYIDTPDKILTAFGTELGGLISTYAQNVRMTLTPGKDVKIGSVLNDLNVIEKDDGTVLVECDDLLAEQEYVVVVKLDVSKRDKTFPRGVSLVKAKVSYVDLVEAKSKTVEASVKVKFVKAGKEDTEVDTKVREEVALQNIVVAQAQALRMADAGNLEGARVVLRNASMDASEIGSARGVGFGDMVLGLVDEHFATADAYVMGGSSATRAVQKSVSRRRSYTGDLAGGVDFGTKAVSDMAGAFEDKNSVVTQSPPASDLAGSNIIVDPGAVQDLSGIKELLNSSTSSSKSGGPGKSRSGSSR